MNPFVAVGSVAIFLLVGSAVMSVLRWLSSTLAGAARWWLAACGLGAAGIGTWVLSSRGAPRDLFVLGGLVAGAGILGSLGRAHLGPRAVLVVSAAIVAEASAVGAWVLWYGCVLQPWARALAMGLAVGVAAFVVVLGLAMVGQLLMTARWFRYELIERMRSERP